MRQAIQTKYLGPTNTRGARIKAISDAKTLTVVWNHACNVEDNHIAAARQLAFSLGWTGEWVGGSLPGAGYCFAVHETGAINGDFTISPETM